MTQVNNSLTTKKKGNSIMDLVTQSKDQFEIALPKHMSGERFTRIALTEIRKNPKLLQCDPKSLLGALMTSAQLGLEPGVLGQAYLIPYKTECQFQISYKGMIELLRRSGQLKDLYAYPVYENDTFEITYGLNRDLVHKPVLKDKGTVTGYYAVAKLTDGTVAFEYMSHEEVEAHAKQFSQSYAKGYSTPWKTSFNAMAYKTVVKQLMKWLPVSVEALNGTEKDESSFTFDNKTKVVKEVEKVVEEIENHDPITGVIVETEIEKDIF